MYAKIHNTERYARQSQNHAAVVASVRSGVAEYMAALIASQPKVFVLEHADGTSYRFTIDGETATVQCGRLPARTMSKQAAREQYRSLLARGFRKW